MPAVKATQAGEQKLLTEGASTLGKSTSKGGRLGKEATRAHVADVAKKLENKGWEITGGGGKKAEEYIAGSGGGRKGSSFPDITAKKESKTIRVNTVDTRANGVTPTTREAANASRIRSQKPGDKLVLVPKPKE